MARTNKVILEDMCERLNSDVLDNRLSKSVTFVAGTTGAIGSFKIATVTGVVAMTAFAVCTTDVNGSGTIEVGTSAATAGLIAQVSGTALDAGEIWHDATPDASLELTSVLTKKIVTSDVYYKIATDTLTAGVVTFYIMWSALSPSATVVIA